MPEKRSTEILVRATVNLPGLPAGKEAMVDPDMPWIKQALKNTTLMKVEDEAETEQKEEQEAEASSAEE